MNPSRWVGVLGVTMAAIMACSSFVTAQTVIDLTKANFAWDWTQGAGGAATEFRIKCGPTVGTYPTVVVVTDPALRVFPVSQVIGGSGTYHCVITAANPVGESAPSGDVFFVAGVTPSSPTNLRVTP